MGSRTATADTIFRFAANRQTIDSRRLAWNLGALPRRVRALLLRTVPWPPTVTLTTFELEPVAGALPADVAAFLAESSVRIDAYFDTQRQVRQRGFFPSDYELAYRTMSALRRLDEDARQLGEWGSGFGVVAGLATFLGYEAHGVEIDPQVVEMSRRLLEDFALDVQILLGSFIPDVTRIDVNWDLGTETELSGVDAYEESDLAIEDLDVILAYPWPNEEQQYCDLFEHFADYDAVLLTYSRTEGMRAYRKVGVTRR